ncbi:hypothetical protein MD484_g5475, partial [Candolleomyces efflorescens]
MTSKISKTHNFSGNEVSSQMGPYNPGTYDPPQAYPIASSYTPSAVAADALMSGPPNPRPRSRNKLLKKISKHFAKPESETKQEPVQATAIIDWEAIVAETGSLSRYPALCTSSSGAALHAHPHKRLPERDRSRGRPNTESINDLGVMKNPSRTPKDEEPEWESESETDSSFGSQSDKTRWPSQPPSRSHSPSASRASSRAPSASGSRPHSRSSRHGSRHPDNDGASYYSNQHLLPPSRDGHHGSTHSDHHSTHSQHAPPALTPSTHSSTRPRAYSTSHASTHSNHSTSNHGTTLPLPPPSTHSATEDPVRRMEADLRRTTAPLNTASPRYGPAGWSPQAAEEYRRYPPVPLASSTSSHKSSQSHRSRHSLSHPSALVNHPPRAEPELELEPYGHPYDSMNAGIRSSRRHSGVPIASSTAEFHDMKDHGRLVNPNVAMPVVPQQFYQAHPESSGFYQYAGWSGPAPGSSPTMPHAFPVPVPPGSTSSHGHGQHVYGNPLAHGPTPHGYGYPPVNYGSVPVSTSMRSSRSSRSDRRASEAVPISTSEGANEGGGWMSWRPAFGRSRSKSVDQLQAAREADQRERERERGTTTNATTTTVTPAIVTTTTETTTSTTTTKKTAAPTDANAAHPGTPSPPPAPPHPHITPTTRTHPHITTHIHPQP